MRELSTRTQLIVIVIVLSKADRDVTAAAAALHHRGATWHSSIYRDQIRDGANILGDVVPIVIHLMMENAQGVWGDACYPVVE